MQSQSRKDRPWIRRSMTKEQWKKHDSQVNLAARHLRQKMISAGTMRISNGLSSLSA